MAATCGGAKSCATCHVYIGEGSPPVGLPDEDEIDLLSESDHFHEGVSRLSCQIVLVSTLSGLHVELAPQD
ncbi:Putidaredoxin [compost metagenome]